VVKPQQVTKVLVPVHGQEQAGAVRGEQGGVVDAEPFRGKRERLRKLGGKGGDTIGVTGLGRPDLSVPAGHDTCRTRW
jgi:hypothetical protein